LLLAPLGIERRALRRGGAANMARVARSGMGEAKSRAFAAELAAGRSTPPPTAIVVAGMGAGMLGLLPGDVVVASEVRDPDGAVFACPWADTLAASLTDALRSVPVRVHTGPVATVRKLVRSSERGALARAGVVAADMESAFLLTGLGAYGTARPARTAQPDPPDPLDSPHPLDHSPPPDLPWAVVRVVSDAPGHELLRPGIVRDGLRAYRSLKACAPALSAWLLGVSSGRGADSVPLPPPGDAREADLGTENTPAHGAAGGGPASGTASGTAGGTAQEQDGGGR